MNFQAGKCKNVLKNVLLVREVSVLLRIPWDPDLETEAPMVTDIDHAPVMPGKKDGGAQDLSLVLGRP